MERKRKSLKYSRENKYILSIRKDTPLVYLYQYRALVINYEETCKKTFNYFLGKGSRMV